MPVINIDLAKGQVDEQQKKEMIVRFTETAADIMNFGKEKFTVFINESPAENIGVGGAVLKELLAGK